MEEAGRVEMRESIPFDERHGGSSDCKLTDVWPLGSQGSNLQCGRAWRVGPPIPAFWSDTCHTVRSAIGSYLANPIEDLG